MSIGSSPRGGPTDASELAVIIPTQGEWGKLRITLRALEQQTAHGFETIVVVDGASPGVPPLSGARLLRQDLAGPGEARNRGVAATDHRLILFIDDGTVPRPDLVARHVAHHLREPAEQVAVLGRLVWHPSVPNDRLRRWLTWSGALSGSPASVSGAKSDPSWRRFHCRNVSMKRGFFLASGGFDPDFAFTYEDLPLAWRLAQCGVRLLYDPRAVVEDLDLVDWTGVTRHYERLAVAERLMVRKHEGFPPLCLNEMSALWREPRVSRMWTVAADWMPRWMTLLRRKLERRADRHYRQRLALSFLSAWNASAPHEATRLSSST